MNYPIRQSKSYAHCAICGKIRKCSDVPSKDLADNTKDLDNPFIRDGHDSASIELDIEDLIVELDRAFACYIAWEWKPGEFDESKAQRAYRKIKEVVSHNERMNEQKRKV